MDRTLVIHRRQKEFFSPAFRKNRRRASEVELESTSRARRRQSPAKVVVAGGVCSLIHSRSKRRSLNLLRWLIYLIDLAVDNVFLCSHRSEQKRR